MEVKINIQYQDEYSRSELLLRSFLGFLYLLAPHELLLFFVNIWTQLLSFLSFWIILFTGRFPEGMFVTIVKGLRWNWRVIARMHNLCDGYPAIGLDGDDDKTEFVIPYPEKIERGSVLMRAFLGWLYVLIPHSFCLYFLLMLSSILSLLSWFIVLFTGRFPQSWHEFITGTNRWSFRVHCYLLYLTRDYPPFSGKEQPEPV